MSRGLNRRRLLGASLVATLSMVACGRKPPRAQAVPPGATVLGLKPLVTVRPCCVPARGAVTVTKLPQASTVLK